MSWKTKTHDVNLESSLNEPSSETLEKINKFSRRPMKSEEVYVFPLVLCDNEIDRDGERFSVSALETLAKLFIGKTGVFDHSMKGTDQTARIFETYTEQIVEKTTESGETYMRLMAMAYMVRTAENESLIREIDAGIKKEVSVGCAVQKMTCSVCGGDFRRGECTHEKGQIYAGKKCHCILEEPTDAYEWSFVAVPSQPAAGVTKSFNNTESLSAGEIINKCRTAVSPVTLTAEQARELTKRLDVLEKQSADGRLYREQLKTKVMQLWMERLPRSSELCVISVCDRMETSELLDLEKAFSAHYDAQVQLYAPSDLNENTDDFAFKI